MAGLKAKGVRVANAKVGPDFIDPTYHCLASGKYPRNLDSWMCGAEYIPALAEHAGEDADILVVEGVMGLFDGGTSTSDTPSGATELAPSSTGQTAWLLDCPVILVVDVSSLAQSVAALVKGYVEFSNKVRVAGVIFNRVGSKGHEKLLRDALMPLAIPVYGALAKNDAWLWEDRHLGLVPAVENSSLIKNSIRALGQACSACLDLEGIMALAKSAGKTIDHDGIDASCLPPTRFVANTQIAVAKGKAFSFIYQDNLERLEEAGAELAFFDPLVDEQLPKDINGLYIGGGFPEVFVRDLAANTRLMSQVRQVVNSGLPTWAECGGLLWLAKSLDRHELCGVIPAEGKMSQKLTLGYKTARLNVNTPIADKGEYLKGHEFHYSVLTPPGDGLLISTGAGNGTHYGGFASPEMLASYLHIHLGTAPTIAENFISSASKSTTYRPTGTTEDP